MVITKNRTGNLEQFHRKMEEYWSKGFLILHGNLNYPVIIRAGK